MRQSLSVLADQIKSGEKWMMHVEKRRYTLYHKADIIAGLADLVNEKVDLNNPDKIVWLEIVGKQTGMAVIRPGDIFSLSRMRV